MTAKNPEKHFQVVIVGSGPTGLSLAIELAGRGVRCLLVERNTRASLAPRAKTTNVRTREHLRRWGIADKLAEASPFGVESPTHVHFVTRLGGRSLVRFDHVLNGSPTKDQRYSEHMQWIPQYKLEAVLKAHADTLKDMTIEYGQELVDFAQDDHGVSVELRDKVTGTESSIRADYLVGADGARSTVRELIGATMQGRYGLSRNYNIIFEAPGLDRAHEHGPGIMFWQINADVPSLIGPMDKGDLWYFMPTKLEAGHKLTDAEAIDLIRRATAIDLPYRIISSEEWVASSLLADRYSSGRAFLVGDACHLHPPFGGFGMNMGVGDAVDLGWKMAATIQGWGGPDLLATYEIERRPVHKMVMDEAESNHSTLSNQLVQEDLESDTSAGERARASVAEAIRRQKYREFNALSVVLGYSYAGSPIVVTEEGATTAGPRAHDYVPDAVPGSLAPHAWLSDGRSLYDLFGAGYTLLVLGVADVVADDVAAARADAITTSIPLKIAFLTEPAVQALYESRLALIRPDQHIAWRGDHWPGPTLLSVVTGSGIAHADAR